MSAALDDLAVLAEAHASTDLIITHHGETVLEFIGPIDEARANAIDQVLDDGRAIQDAASAQKAVVAVLLGVAEKRGLLRLSDRVARWLGDGWDPAITLHHLVSMTSGLREDLSTRAEPGEVWDYNLGAAYHSTKLVLTEAAGADLDSLTADWLTDPLRMTESRWVDRVWNDAMPEQFKPSFVQPDGSPVQAFHTSGRDLSTFAVAVCEALRGERDLGIELSFLDAMRTASSPLNPAYGIFWWVNTGEWGLAPKVRDRIDGPWFPGSPPDAIFALGAGDRMAAVIPSLDATIVRLGAPADTPSAAGSSFLRRLTAQACEILAG